MPLTGPFLTSGILVYVARGVNFNSTNTDTQLPIALPPGFSLYQVIGVRVANPSAALTGATLGVFTAASGGGQTVAADQSVTGVSATAVNTNNNSLDLTKTNSLTEAYNVATLFVRVGTAKGSAATADVAVLIEPLS